MPTNYTSMIQNAITQYANDGVELYNALQTIHGLARTAGDSVTYPSGATLNITIPSSASSILLSPNTDFNNCEFRVTNTTNTKVDLFSLEPDNTILPTVTIVKSLLRKNAMVYGSNSELSITPKLIIVKDQTPWTYRTEGGNTPVSVERKDVLYVTGNMVQNDPISTYDNNDSSPTCEWVNVSTAQKTFKNIVFIRTNTSNAVTNLLNVNYQYNVLIENVDVYIQNYTDNGIYNDECIKINNSAKIEMNNVTIDRTYSATNHWGYGIRLLNVWDTSISNLIAYKPEKGVMGNENVNGLTVEYSNLNRVDVHCYGRDITCTNCTFRNTSNLYHIYNRVSSFFGKFCFINCTFDEFLPMRLDSDYNAFTPFDLVLDNCTLNVRQNSFHCLLSVDTIDDASNSRSELQQKCLPNIVVKNFHLNIPSSVVSFEFIDITTYSYTGNIYGMDTFLVDVIEFTHGYPNISISDANHTITLQSPLRRNINMNRNLVGG